MIGKTRFFRVGVATLLSMNAFGQILTDPADLTVALFSQAHRELNLQLARLSSCSLRGVTSVEDERWILERRVEIQSDVNGSRHLWFSDQSTVCATTQYFRYADVQFFQPACRSQARTIRDAQFYLLKETMHHFGVYDEAKAQRLSNAILSADLTCSPFPTPNPQCNPHCATEGEQE